MIKPTIKDVAVKAGVSISTVSRVLNSPDSVRNDKRIKVQEVIDELAYTPNALARGLIFKRTESIGVLIPDISNTYVAEIMRGMEDTAHLLGWNLILCNTDRNKDRVIKYLNILKEKQVDGIIFTSDPITQEYYQLLNHIKLPMVLASTHSLEYPIPSVKIDDEKAAYDAACYLLNRGHRRIGMVSGPTTDIIAGYPRYTGFKQAMKDHHIDWPDDFVEFGDFQFNSGYECVKRLFNRKLDLTAVFCASDEMALGAFSYFHSQGIRVPDQVSVLGFDNTKIARMSIPKLSTVSQPMYEIGKEAVIKLDKLLKSEPLNEVRTNLAHQIVERESVKSITEDN